MRNSQRRDRRLSAKAGKSAKPVPARVARALKPLGIGLLTSETNIQKKIARRANELNAKLIHLMAHYGIDDRSPQCWKSLALLLAMEFVDGFKELSPQGGRPIKWGDYERGVLVVEIERLQKAEGISATKAAKELSSKEPWCSALSKWEDGKSSFGADRGEALRKIYSEAKRSRYSKSIRKSYCFHVENGDIRGWERAVAECFASQSVK